MNKIKYQIISITLIIFLILLTTNVFAASFSASISTQNVTLGETFTVTVNALGASGTYKVTTSNSNISVISGNTQEFLDNSSATITFKANSVGTVTITATATDMTDNNDDTIKVEGTKTFNVNIKETTPTPTPPTTPDTPTTPTVTEPKFTSANKTVYATGDINLRSSWSTSSGATKISKGTELTLTGTSTDKINGYVWSRVSYNGQTKYVANSLITETKPEEKNANTNLKSLKLSVDGLTPEFKSDVTEYSLEVANNINEISVTTEAEDSKSTVTVEGNKELKVGENIIKITVKSEDGKSTKVYNIKVTKKEEKTSFGLKSLNIKDTNMSTLFKSDVYDYEIDIKDVDKLEIEAIATVEDATIEILGNSELKEGENIITIIVTSKDGKETATYQIKAIKKLAETNTTKTNNIIDTKVIIYASIAGAAFIALIIVIVYTIKNRNVDKYDYDYNDNLNDESDENNYSKNEINEQTQEIEQLSEYDIKDEKPEIDYIQENQEENEYNNDNDDDDDDNRPRRRRGKHF